MTGWCSVCYRPNGQDEKHYKKWLSSQRRKKMTYEEAKKHHIEEAAKVEEARKIWREYLSWSNDDPFRGM